MDADVKEGVVELLKTANRVASLVEVFLHMQWDAEIARKKEEVEHGGSDGDRLPGV